MLEIAASLTESCDAALDPACGAGAFLIPLQQKGFREVRGIDVDELVLKRLSGSPFQLLKGKALQKGHIHRHRSTKVIATSSRALIATSNATTLRCWLPHHA